MLKEISGPGAKISIELFGHEQKKGESLGRCSNFDSTSSDEQNKVIASADVRISARNQEKHHRVRRP